MGRWDRVNNFEFQYKKRFLRKLTMEKSLEIFKDLYLFGYGISRKRLFRKINADKINRIRKLKLYSLRLER